MKPNGPNRRWGGRRGDGPLPRAQRRGVAMMMALFAVAVAAVVGWSFLSSQSTSIEIGRALKSRAKARATAEAALRMAIAEVRGNESWRTQYRHGAWTAASTMELESVTSTLTATLQSVTGSTGLPGAPRGGSGGSGTAPQPMSAQTASTLARNAAASLGQFRVRFMDGGNGNAGDGNLSDDTYDPAIVEATATVDGVTHIARAELIPQLGGGKSVLLLVPDASALSADERARQSLFRQWGYRVTPFSAGSASSAYTAALEGMDAVYVSNLVSASDVGTKLNASAASVITESAAVAQGLLMGRGAVTNISLINTAVVDTNHYITSPLSSNSVSLFRGTGLLSLVNVTSQPTNAFEHYRIPRSLQTRSNYRSLEARSSPLAAGASILSAASAAWLAADSAWYVNRPNLVAIEAGGALVDNSTAPGKRLMLPWGGARFTFNTLSKDAVGILKRSLEWATGNMTDVGGLRPNSLASETLDIRGTASYVLPWDADASRSALTSAQRALLDAYRSRTDTRRELSALWSYTRGSGLALGTNSTRARAVTLGRGAYVYGSILIGPTGVPATVIVRDARAIVSGRQAAMESAWTFNAVAAPNLGPSRGDLRLSSGTTTLTADGLYNTIQITGNATLVINGRLRVACRALDLAGNATIRINDGSTLELYTTSSASIGSNSRVNLQGYDATRLRLLLVGGAPLRMTSNAGMFAQVEGPTSAVTLDTNSQLFGSVFCRSLTVAQSARLCVDTQTTDPSLDSSAAATEVVGYKVRWLEMDPADARARAPRDRSGCLCAVPAD